MNLTKQPLTWYKDNPENYRSHPPEQQVVLQESLRRFGRPQHVVNWSKFTTPLIRKPDIVIPEGPNEYGLVLTRVKPEK